jgi:tetratricopeptide (TPR) repeat protein
MSLAGNYYKKALNNDPDYIEVKKNLFDWYINSGNTLKAKQMAAEILEKEPSNQVLMNFIKQASGMN